MVSLRRLLQGVVSSLLVVRDLRHHHLRGSSTPGCLRLPLRWHGSGGEIFVHNRVFHLKGVNWYGMETQDSALQGLDVRTMDELFGFLKANKFNALRLPFSLKFALDYDSPVPGSEAFKDVELHGLTKREFMNTVVRKAAENEMVVLLDMHRLNDAFIPQLWYSDEFTYDHVLQGWDAVLGDLKSMWNVMGVDLKNEPSGSASWGSSSPATDWNLAAQDIGKHILSMHADWGGLIFVEGINWSRDFRGFVEHPIDFGDAAWNERLVLSPHQYGPSVSNSPMFLAADFPTNMPAEWTSKWGFLKPMGQTVVLGEWGGHYTDNDKIWQDAFADYLLLNCVTNTFVWDLSPLSDDTGGLLKADWLTPEDGKLALMARVQPDPSFLAADPAKKRVCYRPGSYAAPHCVQ